MGDEGKTESTYVLRDNPKKSRRFDEAWPEEKDDLWSRGSYGEQVSKMPGQSNSEVTTNSMRLRKKRRISFLSSPECGNEEENGALCLLMLSTGTYSVSDLYKKIPPMIVFGNKVHSFCSGDEDQQYKKPKVSSLCPIDEHGEFPSTVLNGDDETASRELQGTDN